MLRRWPSRSQIQPLLGLRFDAPLFRHNPNVTPAVEVCCVPSKAKSATLAWVEVCCDGCPARPECNLRGG